MIIMGNEFCRMCGLKCSDFAHSHIVPRSFTPKADNGFKQTVTAGGDGLFKKRMNGIYDDHILCHECEKRLGEYDQYATDIFRDKKGAEWLTCVDGLRLAYFGRVERQILRGFLASVLWRCSVSNVMDCQKIKIGRVYEERIANDLMSGGRFDYVDSLTFALTNHILTHLIMLPAKTHFPVHGGGNVNGYRMNLPGLEFFISLDQRAHPLTMGKGSFDCDGRKCLGATSLSDDAKGLPYIIPDIGHDEESIKGLLPIVASHKLNKDKWFANLRGLNKCFKSKLT